MNQTVNHSQDEEPATAIPQGGVLALGNFDGVHRGHQAVIAVTLDYARKHSIPARVLTLEPHPRSFLAAPQTPFRLTPPSVKNRLLQSLGIEEVITLDFSVALARQLPRDFVEQMLVQHYHVQHVVAGTDFVFGHERTGSMSDMREWLAPHGIGVTETEIDPTCVFGGEVALLEAKNFLEQRVAERTEDLVTSREQLRQLTHQTVLAQENERRRLSRELHDETGQALIGLKFSLDEILAETPENLESTRRKISKTMARVDDLNHQIRNLAHGLHPPILDVAGIDLALNGFCREFSEETHLPVTYSGEDKLPTLSEEISITLYRFVQEALTNAIKHAHASEAFVSLRHNAHCITLSVKDNGGGFDTNTTPKGIGLLGMEERIGLLNGKLEIRSRKRHGTHLKAVVPLASNIPGL